MSPSPGYPNSSSCKLCYNTPTYLGRFLLKLFLRISNSNWINFLTQQPSKITSYKLLERLANHFVLALLSFYIYLQPPEHPANHFVLVFLRLLLIHYSYSLWFSVYIAILLFMYKRLFERRKLVPE